MTATTTDFTIAPEDGWVAVTSGTTTFLAINANSAGVWWLAAASSQPSSVDTQATGTLTTTGTFADGDTVTIGSDVFRFKDTPTLPNDVQTNVAATTALANLAAKVDTVSTTVVATSGASTMTVTANQAGPSTIATTETSSNASWGSATLSGGGYSVVGLRQYTDGDGDDEIMTFPQGIPNKVWIRVAGRNLGGVQPNMSFGVIAG